MSAKLEKLWDEKAELFCELLHLKSPTKQEVKDKLWKIDAIDKQITHEEEEMFNKLNQSILDEITSEYEDRY